MNVGKDSEKDQWVPDLRTVRWAAEQVAAESLAKAIAHDVPLRVGMPPHVPPDLWLAAGDAAYEATWWPIVEKAERMNGLRSDEGSAAP
jgi:hypothetical protein